LRDRIQASIERIPSSIRRIVITLVFLAILAFLFPLTDDDTRNSSRLDEQATSLPEALFTPVSTATETNVSTQNTSDTAEDEPTPRASATPRRGSATTPNTPSAGATTAETCEPPEDWGIYVVRPGDTLDGIARLVGVTVTELVEANCLLDPNRIDVRQEIWVPSLPSPFITPSHTPSMTPTPTATPTPTRSA
jgi:LysM repeat protein